MFYEIDDNYSFIKRLSDNWLLIKAEVDAYDASEYKTYEHSRDGKWDIILISIFGEDNSRFSRKCPNTMKLLSNIPGLSLAVISKLNPGARIPLHTDKTIWSFKHNRDLIYSDDNFLRVHLTLSAPLNSKANNCAIRILDETREWKDGECLMFNGEIEHEVWNNSNEERIVLIVDFLKSDSEFSITNDQILIKQHMQNLYQ